MWKMILKTTEFSFDSSVPRGRAIGRQRGTDDIQIGLPSWKRIVQRPTSSYEESDLEGSEKLIEAMSRTIGHEYTHIATTEEVMAERKKAYEMISSAFKSGGDTTEGWEKYAVTNFMDEVMARSAHGEQQMRVFLNKSFLNYAKVIIAIVGIMIYNDVTGEEAQLQRTTTGAAAPISNYIDVNKVEGMQDLIDKGEDVVTRKMTELASKYKEKLGI